MSTSPQSAIRDDLAVLPIDKWGWVIYRCTYAEDETWAWFRARVEAKSRKSIAKSDAPEIANRLEWTWVEDAASLDGASTAALRERFRAWTSDEVARQPGDYQSAVIPRFRYFVKIDQDVLHSLAESMSLETHMPENAFLKFVDGNWTPSHTITTEGQQAEEQDSDDFWWKEEPLEPIDGCTEEDVGWMRIAPHMISADFYDVLSGDENHWITLYERPPNIVRY
jgi:hypothetical protein